LRNTEITDAVRKLRQALGETQEVFAERLGTAKSSLVRYESTRSPHGTILARLAAIAEEHGQHECVRIFRRALADEVGNQVQPKIDFCNDEERDYVLALLATLRNPEEHQKELRDVKRILDKPRRRNLKELEEWRAAKGIDRAVYMLLAEGKTPVQVADLLGTPIEVVFKYDNRRKFFQPAAELGLLNPDTAAELGLVNRQTPVIQLADFEKTLAASMTTLPLEQLKTMRRVCVICKNVCEPGIEVCPKCRTKLDARSLPVTEPARAPQRKKKTGGSKK
jgi:transcriptional regulator with XRE-family HTH domain